MEKEFLEIIDNLSKNEMVQKMHNYNQHFECNCYDHCFRAAYYTYKICKNHHLDYISATKAAFLHDLFLYDWRTTKTKRFKFDILGLHGFTHPETAYQNACKIEKLNDIEKDVILKHMWPLTLWKLPKYKESIALIIADKICVIEETIEHIRLKRKKEGISYLTIFLLMFIIK